MTEERAKWLRFIAKLETMKKDYEDDTLVSMGEWAGNIRIAKVLQEIMDMMRAELPQ